jgi:hypothetical protein
MFILHDATIANLTPVVARRRRRRRRRNVSGGINVQMQQAAAAMGITESALTDLQYNSGATTPVFLNEEERKKSITLTGKKVNVVSRNITTETSTNLTVVGISSGAIFNVVVTVKPAPIV